VVLIRTRNETHYCRLATVVFERLKYTCLSLMEARDKVLDFSWPIRSGIMAPCYLPSWCSSVSLTIAPAVCFTPTSAPDAGLLARSLTFSHRAFRTNCTSTKQSTRSGTKTVEKD
jgi:hypothetical protein